MLSPEYGILFLAAAGFLLFVMLLTQIVPGGHVRRRKSSCRTTNPRRPSSFCAAWMRETKNRRARLTRMDDGFARMIQRADMNMSPDQALGVLILTGLVAATGSIHVERRNLASRGRPVRRHAAGLRLLLLQADWVIADACRIKFQTPCS